MTRKEAISVINRCRMSNVPMPQAKFAFDMAIEALQTEIVHCKECKHYDEGGFCWHPAAELGDTLATEPTDSCSYGERGEE